MKSYSKGIISILFIFIFFTAVTNTVHAVERTRVCGLAWPAGWFPERFVFDTAMCGSSLNTNATDIVRYDNLPVGEVLTVCYTSGVLPQGWTIQNRWMEPSRCQGNNLILDTASVKHTSCGSYQSQTSCYPPSPTGQLSVSTTSVTVPYGQSYGSVNVSWTTQNAGSACVWISNSGNNPSPWTCGGASGSGAWPYVPAGGNTKFILSTNANGTSPNPVLATKIVTGVAGAQPTLKLVPKYNLVQTGATSGDVLIPATASPSEGPFTFTWNAPGYPSVDLIAQINGGSWTAPLQIAASGTTTQPMPLGTTYNYRMVPHGATSPIFATMLVRGIAAPAPTFSISPAQVIVPPGVTEGNFTFSWTAPGYEYLNLTGQINGGAWGAPFAIQASGSSGMSIPVGSTYKYRFYPPNDTVHILGTLSVTASH